MALKSKESKISKRLESAIQSKQFYEVHQIYKTIYFRCKMKRDYDEAIKSLECGALFLLDNEQYESGSDLSNIIIDILENCPEKINKSNVELIFNLFKKMKVNSDERSLFMSKALNLLGNYNELKSHLNELLALRFWTEGYYMEARYRIFSVDDGYMSGLFLIDLHNRHGLSSEIDLFIAQPVLQYICMKKLKLAAIMFYTYTRKHENIPPGPPFDGYPLLNFVWLLLLSIQGEKTLNVFKILCDKYANELKRDPSFFQYIEKIGHLFFNLPLPESERNSQGGLLGKLFKMVSGSDDLLGDILQPDMKNSQGGSAEAPMTMDELE